MQISIPFFLEGNILADIFSGGISAGTKKRQNQKEEEEEEEEKMKAV